MPTLREVEVHLLPELADPARFAGCTAIVIDVLRASTTMVYALAAECRAIFPCVEIDEARHLADQFPKERVLLAGERHGKKIAGFDLGNSPLEFTPAQCRGKNIVMTTSNGTRALHRAGQAARILLAGFVNFSAVCEQLRPEKRPVHILCAGTEGAVTLEDTLLAGGFVDFLSERCDARLNDSARLAWDCFENNRGAVAEALEISLGGAILQRLGYHEDIRIAGQLDKFNLVPEVRRNPVRVEIGAVGFAETYWKR